MKRSRLPNFLVRIYNFASPSHRKANRERRKDYEIQFEQLQEENLKRVRRMSQLQGHEDMSDFLYDSAHGTGAASRSMHDLSHTRPHSSRRPSNGRPVSMIQDSSYAHSVPEHSYTVRPGNDIPPVPPLDRRGSTASYMSSGRPDSSFAPSSLGTTATSLSSDLDVSTAFNASATPTEAYAGPSAASERRPRPVSMPAVPTRQRSKLRRRNVDWWGPSETTPEEQQEYDDYVQMAGHGAGQRETRIAAQLN